MQKKTHSNSQAEIQTAGVQAVKNFRNAIFTEIDSAFLARVVKYDKKKHIADLQPLAKLSDGQERAQLLDVPVAEQCYMFDEMVDALKPEFAKADTDHALPAHDGIPAHSHTNFVGKLPKKRFMRPGVPVVCVCLDRDSDNWVGGADASTFKPNSSRNHDANDSIVIGVLGGTWLGG